MRNVHGVEVRALTRREVKALKEYGFNHSYYEAPKDLSAEKADECFLKVLEYGVINPDELEVLEDEPLHKIRQVYFGIVAETYGAPGEEKNLQESGNGSQTEKG